MNFYFILNKESIAEGNMHTNQSEEYTYPPPLIGCKLEDLEIKDVHISHP